MAKRKMVKFNIKNLKYAIKTDEDTYDVPKDLAYASALSLETDYDESYLYGDGQKIAVLTDDKGRTGELTVINIEEEYEIDMGRMMKVEGGTAEIQQLKSIEHAIYYEVEALKDGERLTIKNWLYGCRTGKASETYNQTEDDPTVNTYGYPLTVLGINLKEGLEDYVDNDGNTIKAFRVTAYPDDIGYATFGDSVPTPTYVAETGV